MSLADTYKQLLVEIRLLLRTLADTVLRHSARTDRGRLANAQDVAELQAIADGLKAIVGGP